MPAQIARYLLDHNCAHDRWPAGLGPTQVAACGGRTMSTAATEGSEVVRLPQRTPFTMIDNPIIRSMNDYVSLGLYLDLMSRPPGWRINLRDLARSHKQGRIVLAAAMTDLIGRGLVFRVRFQDGGGRWATRTYVCSTAVSAAELAGIRAQFHRCQIETTAELSQHNNDAALSETDPVQTVPAVVDEAADPDDPIDLEPADTNAGQNRHLHPADRRLPKTGTTGMQSPKARFLASGELAPGRPAPGPPQSSKPGVAVLAAQRPDLKLKIPPTGPPPTSSHPSSTPDGPEEEDLIFDNPEDLEPTRSTPAGSALDRNTRSRFRQPGQPAASPALASKPSDMDDLPAPVEDEGVTEVLESVREAWPMLGRRDETKLREGIGQALGTLSQPRLVEHLVANTGGVRHPGRVLLARLDNLPAGRPSTKTPTPWCGNCTSADYRWITTADSAPVRPCPECSPQARRARH